MIEIKGKEDCCGCSACEQICPKKCIDMVSDMEGFWYPKVKQSKCVNCGLCEKVCPVLQKEQKDIIKPKEVYIGCTPENEIRMKSSSGGLFTVLGYYVLEQNGIVFGAVFDENLMVHHVGIEAKEEFNTLQGSKY